LSLLLLALALQTAETPRVIVVSFDAAGYVLTSQLLAEGKLPSFDRMLRGGAWSDGMVTSFPTKTAAAHALLFTGRHGHASGITANSVLRSPPSSWSRLETRNGFFSDSLRAEPVWVSAAGRALETYVFHAPQAYPFRPQPHLNVIYGYTDAISVGEVIAPEAIPGTAESREIRFAVGESWYRGRFFDDPADPTIGFDTLEIGVEPYADAPIARLKPGDSESFSAPIAASLFGRSAWFSLRLFSLSADGSSFALYRSGTSELVTYPSDLLRGKRRSPGLLDGRLGPDPRPGRLGRG
jgi:Type I phosphodiesterase / nucleotide pyrophosphatase